VLSEIAAEHGRFWEFVDAVYRHTGQLNAETLRALMHTVELDPVQAEARIAHAEDAAIGRVNADTALAKRLGVTGTPTYLVLIPGHPPVSANQRTLAAVLNSAAVRAGLAS